MSAALYTRANGAMLRAMASIAAFDDEERARIRARLRALTVRRLTLEKPRACVLVPLCHVGGAPSFLFTKRTETVGTHKGQVSFPGGRMDPDDEDEDACGLRELEEEVGIPPSRVELLGHCHEVMSITGVRVTPVIGFLGEVGDLSELVLEPAEIDVAFTLTLDQLLDPEKREHRQLGAHRRAPFFTAGPHVVWGLTAFILEEVLQEALGIALPPLPG
jgi:8-oxo-dGTP pyrophosphatase MutT (NUDIX family)